MSKQTPAEQVAYDKFVADPLTKYCGVDRASFVAGYETATDDLRQERDELRAALESARLALMAVECMAVSARTKSDELIALLQNVCRVESDKARDLLDRSKP